MRGTWQRRRMLGEPMVKLSANLARSFLTIFGYLKKMPNTHIIHTMRAADSWIGMGVVWMRGDETRSHGRGRCCGAGRFRTASLRWLARQLDPACNIVKRRQRAGRGAPIKIAIVNIWWRDRIATAFRCARIRERQTDSVTTVRKRRRHTDDDDDDEDAQRGFVCFTLMMAINLCVPWSCRASRVPWY